MAREDTLTQLKREGLLTATQIVSIGDAGTLGAGVDYSEVGQGSAVANPSGGATVDTEARTALIALLDELRTLGIIAT